MPSQPTHAPIGGSSSDRPRAGGVSAAATGLRPRIDTSMYDTGASTHGAGPADEPNAPYAGGGAETYSMAAGPQLPDWQAHRTLTLTLL